MSHDPGRSTAPFSEESARRTALVVWGAILATMASIVAGSCLVASGVPMPLTPERASFLGAFPLIGGAELLAYSAAAAAPCSGLRGGGCARALYAFLRRHGHLQRDSRVDHGAGLRPVPDHEERGRRGALRNCVHSREPGGLPIEGPHRAILTARQRGRHGITARRPRAADPAGRELRRIQPLLPRGDPRQRAPESRCAAI